MHWDEDLATFRPRHDLLKRALTLQKQGKMGILWCDEGRLSIADFIAAPGCRRRLSWQELEAEVVAAENGHGRKEAAMAAAAGAEKEEKIA